MNKISLIATAVALTAGFTSCEKCVKCTVVYTDEPSVEKVNEFCDDITLSEAETICEGQEASGVIESGWRCK
jgi:hypothetical protein